MRANRWRGLTQIVHDFGSGLVATQAAQAFVPLAADVFVDEIVITRGRGFVVEEQATERHPREPLLYQSFKVIRAMFNTILQPHLGPRRKREDATARHLEAVQDTRHRGVGQRVRI